MIFCLNLDCSRPINPDSGQFCWACGWRLRLGNRYRALQPLGAGQSSRTYLGWDTSRITQPKCLIKAFTCREKTRLAQATAMEAVRRTVVQLDAVSRLVEIPKLYGYFECDRTQFVVQAFIDGQTADQQLQANGTFSEAQICQLLQSVLPILHTLHQHRIIHRDIQPQNLIQPPDCDRWVLADLGAAKYTTDSGLRRPGTILGEAEYTAPEQLRGQATFASDLYSLGSTCLHLLTGLSPFDLWDVQAQEWRWRSVVVDVSDVLAELLDQCVAMAVSDRYASVAAMTPALAQLGIQFSQSSHPTLNPIPQPFSSSSNATELTSTPERPPQSGLWQHENTLTIPNHTEQSHMENWRGLAFHPANPEFAVVLDTGNVQIWDWQTGKKVRSHFFPQPAITAIAYSPDGQYLISGSRDLTVQIWQLSDQQLDQNSDLKLIQTLTGHDTDITAIATSPNGQQIASADASGQVQIWLLSTQERLRTLTGHQGSISAIAFTPSDSLNAHPAPEASQEISQEISQETPLLVTASWDMTVQIRYPETGGIKHTLRGHALPVSAIALHPNGQILATGSHDQTVMLWNLVTGEKQSAFNCDAGIAALSFSPDHNALVVVTKMGTVQTWQLVN